MRTANIPTITVFWTSAVWSNSPHSAYHDVLLELLFSLRRGFFTLSEQTKHPIGTLSHIHACTARQNITRKKNLCTSWFLLPPYFQMANGKNSHLIFKWIRYTLTFLSHNSNGKVSELILTQNSCASHFLPIHNAFWDHHKFLPSIISVLLRGSARWNVRCT